ncbi:MAG TPA: hypothetical protein VMF10_16365 [Candidatus Aquilonibacter sp.]|nr:hypothetical protein [Candidatus Aquilonibacter sp.]
MSTTTDEIVGCIAGIHKGKLEDLREQIENLKQVRFTSCITISAAFTDAARDSRKEVSLIDHVWTIEEMLDKVGLI